MNAKIHAGKGGEMLWDRCIELGIEARKKLREFCRHYAEQGREAEEKWFFDLFVPDVVTIRGSPFTEDVSEVPWEQLATSVIKREQRCWNFRPESAWHGYRGYSDGYAMVDPNKLALVTPGINRKTGGYLDFGVPATVVANFLREQRVVPEKCDLNSILFLMTPAEDESKLNTLIAKLVKFKSLWDRDAPLCRGIANAERGAQRALRRLHPATGLQGDARFLSQGEGQGVAGAVLPGREFPGACDAASGGLPRLGGQRSRLHSHRGGEGACRSYARPDLPAGHRGGSPRGTLDEECADRCWTTFSRSKNRSNRFPGFNYEVQGVYQERSDGRMRP